MYLRRYVLVSIAHGPPYVNYNRTSVPIDSFPISCEMFSDYPWDMSDILKGLQEWMFLPDPNNKPEIGKIACKKIKVTVSFLFVLLFLVQ